MDKFNKPTGQAILPKTNSNNAVKDYFSDLLAPAQLDMSSPSVNVSPVEQDSLMAKMSDAERLLQKAQDLQLLLNETEQQITPDSDIAVSKLLAPLDKKRSTTVVEKPYFEDSHNIHIDQLQAQTIDTAVVDGYANETADIQNNHQENLEFAEIKDMEVLRDTSVSLQEHLDNRFQVLLCEVAGLTLAIPLVELGGIHQLTKVSPIVGKPDWFMGLLIKGSDKYQCIDTARWIMPEKYTPQLADKLDYKFAIQLGKTPYVICCESISTTIELSKEDVKWRVANDDKRPWLAGLLKERMCALVDGAKMVQVVLGNMQ